MQSIDMKFFNKLVLNPKNILIILITFLIIAGGVIYLGYGATMINPDNEKSIINHLSTDKNKPINILAVKKYGNSFLIVYSDPSETETNKYSSHFSRFVKHKLYPNRYQYCAGSLGNQTQVMVDGMLLYEEKASDENKLVYAIANVASDETTCSVFELNEDLFYIKKLDEIEVPKTPYILIKEYNLENKQNEIVVHDGSIDLEDFTEE